MPSLAQSLGPFDRNGFEPVAPQQGGYPLDTSGREYPPNPNPFLRCTLPPVSVTPDSLRQFYRGGLVPQSRLMTPPSNATPGTSGGTSTTIISSTSTTGGSGAASETAPLVVWSSFTSSVLNPGDVYNGSVQLTAMFIVQSVIVTAPARVQLYSTAVQRALDAGRPVTVSVLPGTAHGLILDVNLDTSATNWLMSPAATGANGDTPQTATGYVAVTNTGLSSTAITVVFQYAQLQV